MLTFSIFRSIKSDRVYIYDQNLIELAQCENMNAVFNYFYSLCEKASCNSVLYSQTKDKHIIHVILD